MKAWLLSQIFCIAAAYLLDACVGDPEWFPHPVRLMGAYILWFKKHFYHRTLPSEKLRRHGLAMVISSVFLFGAGTVLILWIAFQIHPAVYLIVKVIILCTCLAPTCMRRETKMIYKVVCTGDLEASRKQLSRIVGRDTTTLSMEKVILAAVESTAENTEDGTISPLFYMMIGGAPLAVMFKMSSTMDSMVGYDNDQYHDFGRYPAKNDDLWNFLPARIAGFCLVLAAWMLPDLSGQDAFRVMKRDHRQHLSPNCGWPEAASAGALGLKMGGTHIYYGKVVPKPYIGDVRKAPEPEDILKMNRLMTVACTLFLLFGLLILFVLFLLL